MSKDRAVTALALAALLGLAACGGDAEEPQLVEESVVESPAEEPEIDARVMEGAIMMDTGSVGAVRDPVN